MSSPAMELRSRLEQALQNRIPHALTPPQRPAPERMLTRIPAVDALTGGIPLGCLTEICGPASSGRTSLLFTALAEAMRRDEICALVDPCDAFDPQSAARAGVDLARLLWVRGEKKSGDRAIGPEKESGQRVIGSAGEVKKEAVGNQQSAAGFELISTAEPRFGRKPRADGRKPRATSPDGPITRSSDTSRSPDAIEQALKATDLLLQAGGFGVVVLDLADLPISSVRRIPLTTWFRFRRAVENTSTAFIVVEQHPHAKSCATLVMDLRTQPASWTEAADHNGIIMGTHSGAAAPSFCVTAEGVALPFEKSRTSSFEMPQRWNTPRARLLNTVHVHLQVTRSRNIMQPQKLPVQAFKLQNNLHNGDAEEFRNLQFRNRVI
jgi:recombination protein RecA